MIRNLILGAFVSGFVFGAVLFANNTNAQNKITDRTTIHDVHHTRAS